MAEIEGIEFLARDLQEFVCKDLPDAGRRRGTFQVPVGGYDEQAGFCFTGRAWKAPSLRPQWQRGGKAMRMNKLVGAIMVAGCMGLAGAAHAVSVTVDYTGDNEVTGFWAIDRDVGTVVELFDADINNNDWTKGTTQTVTNLPVGEYYFVFRNENLGQATPPDNGPAAFLAAITGTVEESVYTDGSWQFAEVGGCADGELCPDNWNDAELTDGQSGSNDDEDAKFGDANVWANVDNNLDGNIFKNSYC
ncbi:hypothetical protein, partial [Thioalkalivibrio sp.]|uniref:hypothetical protein n=1 Tax=Thioalkalivibrio sp. TaxID=2093813 RepID=UPI0039755170